MLDRRTFLGAGLATVAGVATLGRRARAQPPGGAPAARRLLLVHGRAQQGKDPVALRAEWISALERGAAKSGRTLPEGLEAAFPFYGDVLDDFTREAAIPLTADVHTKGDVHDDFLEFEAAVAEALRLQAGISDEQVDEEYGANPKPKGPQNWEWVQAILRTLDKHGGGLSGALLEQFMRDVYLYSNRKKVRRTIDEIVAADMPEEPTVVVGHSLGSVVAYSVLRQDDRRLEVPLFVTVGSPLGVRPIRKAFRPLKSPAPVASWWNAYDRRDVVALYPLDERNFPVQPAIENFKEVRNSTHNRHGIDGYLDDETVAGRILDALSGPSV